LTGVETTLVSDAQGVEARPVKNVLNQREQG